MSRGMGNRFVCIVAAIASLLAGLNACAEDAASNAARASGVVYAPDGKGWLTSSTPGKYLLHVQGSPYEMGYQHGYLMADRLGWILSNEFYVRLILEFMEIEVDDIGEILASPGVDAMVNLVIVSSQDNEKYISPAFIEEMQGIVDGARDAGYGEVTYDRVLMTNLGFDAMLSRIYPLVTPCCSCLISRCTPAMGSWSRMGPLGMAEPSWGGVG
jgi:hypothetical protein